MEEDGAGMGSWHAAGLDPADGLGLPAKLTGSAKQTVARVMTSRQANDLEATPTITIR